MADTTITSANSVFTLVAAGLFPAPIQIQNFATDKAFALAAYDVAEVQMGVDGRMSAGYIPTIKKQTVTLMADSPSRSVFATILEFSNTTKNVYWLSASIELPGTGEAYSLTRGILTTVMPIPDVLKVLGPVDFIISWENINRSLL